MDTRTGVRYPEMSLIRGRSPVCLSRQEARRFTCLGIRKMRELDIYICP